MTKKKLLEQIRKYARENMGREIAHDYSHAFRVGILSRKIAEREGYKKSYVYEIAGLLHDIGLGHGDRAKHGETGARIAESYLQTIGFSQSDIKEICFAISWHNRKLQAPRKSVILDVLSDADTLDLLGAVGIWRGIIANGEKYVPMPNELLSASAKFNEYNENLSIVREKNGHSLSEQINFQIESAKILTTNTAKKMADPLLATMRNFRYMMVNELSVMFDGK